MTILKKNAPSKIKLNPIHNIKEKNNIPKSLECSFFAAAEAESSNAGKAAKPIRKENITFSLILNSSYNNQS